MVAQLQELVLPEVAQILSVVKNRSTSLFRSGGLEMNSLLCTCQLELCSYDDICFYEQKLGAWHLIVKPERMEETKRSASFVLVPDAKGRTYAWKRDSVQCSSCGNKVGNEAVVGPAKEIYICFNQKGLSLPARGGKWKDIIPWLPNIEIRNWDPGFPTASDSLRNFGSFSSPKETDFSALDISGLTCTQPRNYQVELFVRASGDNSIVCMPTGAGKTLVAVMVVKFLKKLNPKKTAIFLADRIPLVHQQAKVMEEEGGLMVKIITGENDDGIDKVKLDEISSEYDAIALTADKFWDILVPNGLQMSQCCVIVFDEAHHARGHHAFSRIMEEWKRCPFESQPRILGLTASVGGESSVYRTAEKVRELCSTYANCNVLAPVLFKDEMEDILSAAATEYADVIYTAAEIHFHHELAKHLLFLWKCELAEFRINNGRDALDQLTEQVNYHNLKDLLTIAVKKKNEKGVKLVEYALCVLSFVDESDVYGIVPIKAKLTDILSSCGKKLGVPIIRQFPKFLETSDADKESGFLSSRVKALLEVVKSVMSTSPFPRILVFVQTRDKARRLVSILEGIPDIASLRPSRLVGHSGFDGMTWMQEQKPMLDRFRSGIVRLLISTSVLEEGLDVPSCNAVIRFDGMGSMTGTVQSRGRARHRESRFVVLLREEERKRTEHIRLQEMNMLNVVEEFSTSLSQSLHSVVQHLTEKLREDERRAVLENNSSGQAVGENDDSAEEFRGHSYVIKMKFHSKWLQESLLLATLSDFAHVLKCDIKCSLIHLYAFDGDDSVISYQNICRKAIPRLLEGEKHLWLQKSTMEPPSSLSACPPNNSKLHLKSAALGYFKDPSTFLQAWSLDKLSVDDEIMECSSLIVTRSGVCLSLCVPGRLLSLEFPLAAIYMWVLVHHEVDHHSKRVYIPLRQAPYAYSSDAGKRQRIGADAGKNDTSTAFIMNTIGEYFVYEIVFAIADQNQQEIYTQFLHSLKSHGVLMYDSIVTDKLIDKQPSNSSFHKHPDLSYASSYSMECIFSQHGHVLTRPAVPDDFYKVLSSYSQSIQECVLLAMTGQLVCFCDPLMLLFQAVKDISPLEELPGYLVPRNHVLVRSATVTPSRIIFYEPLTMKSSRMLRHFSSDHFLKVSFREEDMSFLHGGGHLVLQRVRQLLSSGVHVAGRKFVFLGSSSSMLRSHSCWMTCLEPREVRTWLGDFDSIELRCVGKYMARVGMGMASSDVTISVSDEVIKKPMRDIEVGSYCFSDGIGKISRECLSQVLYCLQRDGERHNDVASALQIRVAGYKGVLVLDPTISSQCVLRESMFKFKSLHRQLEVLKPATSLPLYLNRQSIVLLSSLGVKDSAFESLQEQELQKLLSIFSKHQAEQEISWHFQNLDFHAVRRSGWQIHTEPFMQLLLTAVYNGKMKSLTEKTQILVPDGRLLMGVMDETFSLNYGEIFVQLCDSSTNWEMQIIRGPCVTYKNPCFHPGDVRKLLARDVPNLHHLVNCVVFPAKGHRPHPDEMSGSDLDGDLYSVIWMPDLIPERDHEPMSYDTGSAEQLPEVTESAMIHFFSETMENVQLGRIANAHLALSDLSEAGALDKDCLKLAELHAVAVDFPKTGVQVHIPEELIPRTCPDFMEKHSRPSYPSDKVLGRLYRRARGLTNETCNSYVGVIVNPDISFLRVGHQKLSAQARETYENYRTSIRSLIHCYGIRNEAEVVTGCPVRMHDHLSSGIVHWAQILRKQYKELRQRFRNQFEEHCRLFPEQKDQLASAWYFAAYTDKDLKRRCLSFPWLVADVLTTISERPHLRQTYSIMGLSKDLEYKARLGSGNDANFYQELGDCISESVLLDFNERQRFLYESLLEREDLCEKVEMCIKAGLKDLSVKMFGSSSTFVFEPAVSDVDLIIRTRPHPLRRRPKVIDSCKAQIKLLDEALPLLRQDFPGIYAVHNTPIPILKYGGSGGTLPFDLTANDSGLRKSNIICNYILCYPALLLLLTVIVRWARHIGLTAHQPRKQLSPFGLSWLLIQFCVEQGFIEQPTFREDLADGRPSNLLASVLEELSDPTPTPRKRFANGECIGEVVLSFFRKLSDLNLRRIPGATTTLPFSLPDPVEGSTSPCIEMDVNMKVLLQNKCLQGWHTLTRTRNVKSLFSLGERFVCLRLSRFQNALFRGSEEYYAERLLHQSGGKAKVRIFSPSTASSVHKQSRRGGSKPLYAEIEGDPAAVLLIEKCLQELNGGQSWIAGRGTSYFVKDATFLLFEGSLSDEDLVGFLRYSEPYHLKHAHRDRHVPVLVAPVGGADWKAHALGKLRRSVWRQRGLLLQCPLPDASSWDKLHCSGELHALIRFGTLYVTNVPSALESTRDSVSVTELEEYVVRGRGQALPWRAVDPASSEPEESDSDSEESIAEECLLTKRTPKLRTKRKTPKRISQSLFPQVSMSPSLLGRILGASGFSQTKEDYVKYAVSVFTPKEYRISLNEKLEFISLAARPVRWLSGSLLLKSNDREHNTSEGAPNCLRFYLEMKSTNITEGELLTRAQDNPVLMFRGADRQLVVAPAFEGQANYVRQARKQEWTSSGAGLTVTMLDVCEWEEWDARIQKFKRVHRRQELELHFHNAHKYVVGSTADCDLFIQTFWETAMEFRHTVLDRI